jgi:FkbM family methyltransferase
MASLAASALPDRVFVALIARAHRRFEPEIKRVVAAYPGGGTFVDVGAWYGPWTHWIAPKAARVVAFEPNPDVARVLAATVAGNVTVVRAAASSEVSTAVLSLPEGGRGTEGRASLEVLTGSGRAVEVPTQRIDDLDVVDVRLVKIDVEGHEMPALEGARALLERDHPVLCVELEERHGGIAPAVDWLGGLGYRGQVLVGGHWIALDDFDLAAHQLQHAEKVAGGYLKIAASGNDRYVNNVVFVHPESTWSVR